MNTLYKILILIIAVCLIIIAISPTIIKPVQNPIRNFDTNGTVSIEITPNPKPTPTLPPLTPAPTASPTPYPTPAPTPIYIPANRVNITYFETIVYTPMDMSSMRGASYTTAITVTESFTIDSTVNCTLYFNKFILMVFLQSTQTSPFQTTMGMYPLQQLTDHIDIINGTTTKASISYMYNTFYRSPGPQIGSLQYNDYSLYNQYPDLSLTIVKIN